MPRTDDTRPEERSAFRCRSSRALSILPLLLLSSVILSAQSDSLLQRAITTSNEGRFAESIGLFLQAGADSGDASARAQLGMAYARLNDFPNARRFLSEAVRLDPANVDIHFQYALFLHQNLVLPEALQTYRRVLELDSTHGPAWFHFAQISRVMQDPVDAVRQYYRTSIRLNPNDYLAYYYLGSSLADSADTHHEGEFFLLHAAELNPFYLPTIERLGTYYSGLRKDSLAAQQYLKAVRLRPKNPDFWFYMGESLRKMRRADSAIVCFREAMRLDPSQSIYVGQLGYAYVQLKRYGDAVEAYRKAISLEPDNVQFYRNLAIAYERLDSIDAAAAAYMDALQALEPAQFADLFNQVGHIRYRAHDYVLAGEAYQRALTFDPDNHDTIFFLALVLDQTNDYPNALRRYREFLRLVPATDSLTMRTNVARTRVEGLTKMLSKPQ